MQRPTGITILAVLAAIGGVLGLLGIGLSFALYGAVFGVLSLLLAVAELAIAYGFWTLKPWAWQWGIVLAVVAVLYSVVQAVALGSFAYGGAVITIVIFAIVLYYLNTPQVRSAFGAPEKGWPFMGGRY